MDGIPQAVIDGAGSMSTTTLLWIIAGLMTVITTMGGVVTSLVNKRSATALQQTNPLNGTLMKLNEVLIKVDMRTGDSDRVLESHTEKLIVMGTTMAQLAANEAAQTIAISRIMPQIDDTITGCATRQEQTCKDRTGMILNALET